MSTPPRLRRLENEVRIAPKRKDLEERLEQTTARIGAALVRETSAWLAKYL